MNKAVFLDRDGVINEVLLRDGRYASPRSKNDFTFIDGIGMFVADLKEKGYLVIVATNQPDLARELLPKHDLDAMHQSLSEKFAVDDIYVCPHVQKDDCSCRKPRPGMLLEAAVKWRVDMSRSFMVGDMERDIEAGRQAGCRTVLVRREYNQDVRADHVITAYTPLTFESGTDPF